MTVAFDVATEGPNNTSSLTDTVSHAAASTGVEGVWILGVCEFDGDATASVSYGGTACTTTITLNRATGLNWTTVFGFLGDGNVSQGTQNAQIVWGSTTAGTSKRLSVVTVTADGNLSINGTDSYQIDNETDPTDTLPLNSLDSFCIMGWHHGNVSDPASLTGWTQRTYDAVTVGAYGIIEYDTVASTDVTYGPDTAGAADGSMMAMSVTEASGATASSMLSLLGVG